MTDCRMFGVLNMYFVDSTGIVACKTANSDESCLKIKGILKTTCIFSIINLQVAS